MPHGKSIRATLLKNCLRPLQNRYFVYSLNGPQNGSRNMFRGLSSTATSPSLRAQVWKWPVAGPHPPPRAPRGTGWQLRAATRADQTVRNLVITHVVDYTAPTEFGVVAEAVPWQQHGAVWAACVSVVTVGTDVVFRPACAMGTSYPPGSPVWAAAVTDTAYQLQFTIANFGDSPEGGVVGYLSIAANADDVEALVYFVRPAVAWPEIKYTELRADRDAFQASLAEKMRESAAAAAAKAVTDAAAKAADKAAKAAGAAAKAAAAAKQDEVDEAVSDATDGRHLTLGSLLSAHHATAPRGELNRERVQQLEGQVNILRGLVTILLADKVESYTKIEQLKSAIAQNEHENRKSELEVVQAHVAAQTANKKLTSQTLFNVDAELVSFIQSIDTNLQLAIVHSDAATNAAVIASANQTTAAVKHELEDTVAMHKKYTQEVTKLRLELLQYRSTDKELKRAKAEVKKLLAKLANVTNYQYQRRREKQVRKLRLELEAKGASATETASVEYLEQRTMLEKQNTKLTDRLEYWQTHFEGEVAKRLANKIDSFEQRMASMQNTNDNLRKQNDALKTQHDSEVDAIETQQAGALVRHTAEIAEITAELLTLKETNAKLSLENANGQEVSESDAAFLSKMQNEMAQKDANLAKTEADLESLQKTFAERDLYLQKALLQLSKYELLQNKTD